jgi:hypothetical protein
MKRSRALLVGRLVVELAIAVATCLVLTGQARADCSTGGEYVVHVKGTTVEVLPESSQPMCGGSVPMLRQDVVSGEVVQLAGSCVDGEYVDECVPPGIYRYGFATAFDCSENHCGSGVEYWGAATVDADATEDDAGACTRSAGNTAPAPYAGNVPWPASGTQSKACPSGCACSSTSGTVLSIDGALVVLSLIWVLRRGRAAA